MPQLTLIAEARPSIVPDLPTGFTMREPRPVDAEQLGRLIFESHIPGATHANIAEAITEMHAGFRGEFGEPWPGASGLIEHEGDVVAALLAVHRAPWYGTPDCPFVTDLFADQRFRRLGLARALLMRCLAQASMIDRARVALRVDSANAAAVRLYESLDFRPYR